MAKYWYFAKCDKCMEVAHVMVNNPICTMAYLGDEEKSAQIGLFLIRHYGCELSLGWRDDHLDKLWEEGYTNADLK